MQKQLEQSFNGIRKSQIDHNEIIDIKLKYDSLMKEMEIKESFLSQFFSAAIHELRLPLQALIIGAENLLEEAHERDIDINFIRETMPNMLFEAFKLNQFVANIQEMIQMPLGKKKYEYRLLPIYQFIEQAIKRFEPEAKSKGITIKKPSYAPGPVPILPLAEDEIVIAFDNLYSNAVRYSYIVGNQNPTEGIITTACSDIIVEEEKFFRIEITNFGYGITQEEIGSGKIFTAGYRGILSRDRIRAIPGVGLYIIKHVVEKIHKGKIEVSSEQKQDGYVTAVKVMLPYKVVSYEKNIMG